MQIAQLYTDVFEVEQRLKALGLRTDTLLDAVRAGLDGRLGCTELDPPMYPGQTMWAHTLRRLRQRTALHNWKPNNDGNYSVALSPDELIAIAVSTGDANTGRPNATPGTMSRKGPRTAEVVAANQLLLDLRIPGEATSFDSGVQLQRETWLLLIHMDDDEVRAELSLPLTIDEYDFVTGWRERIILPSIDFDRTQIEIPSDNSPDIDIDVRRRG
jgi:hypothetical protein